LDHVDKALRAPAAPSAAGQLIFLWSIAVVMIRPASRRRAAVERDLRERGYTLEEDDWLTVARDGPMEFLAVDAPLAVVPLTDGRPLSVVSAVANAAHEGRVPVLVADAQTRAAAATVLSDPFALAGYDDGRRLFHAVEDRILLTDDTFACVQYGDLQWVEATPEAETEDPGLRLTVDDDVVAALDSVDALTCPGPDPEAFPYRYGRTDGRFRVFAGPETVGQYGTVAAMRADGYRPVPLPLVPEHHVREHAALARATVLADTDGDVTYEPLR
jgi:hypothetical protein